MTKKSNTKSGRAAAASSSSSKQFPWRLATWVVLAGVVSAGGYLAWQRVAQRIHASPHFAFDPQQIEITPRPEWIRGDLRRQIIQHGNLTPPTSLLEPDLTRQVAQAFALHPWVERVDRVQKLPTGKVQVDLTYRRPVCMVEVARGLLPVDVQGVLLPSEDFSPVDAEMYPRLIGVETAPLGSIGTRWGDGLVDRGAQLADVLVGVWREFSLRAIAVTNDPATAFTAGEPSFDLLTAGGSRIVWGRAPTAELPGEPLAQEKLARLRRHLVQHHSLDGEPLDLRQRDTIEPAPHTASDPAAPLQ